MLKYNTDQEQVILSRMYFEGSDFEKNLSLAYRTADKWEQIKIEAMFPEYFEKYFVK